MGEDGQDSSEGEEPETQAPPAASLRREGSNGFNRSSSGNLLIRAGSNVGATVVRAGSNLGLQRASTLPTDNADLRHAAREPGLHDMEADKACCGGLWKAQQCFGCVLGIFLLALLTVWHPMQDYPVANYMLGITLLCGSFWVFEVIPIYITGLLPLILMPMYTICSTDIAAKAYWNQVQLLVVSTYLIDLALEEVQLPRRASLKLLLATGVVQPGLLLFSFMAMCYVLSMFCNSIAVTLMITPFAIGLMGAAEEQARNSDLESDEDHSDSDAEDGLLLGIAYASTCGGITSLTGAIPNEVMTGIPGMQGILTYRSWMLFALPASLAAMICAFIVIYVRYIHGLRLSAMTQEVLEVEWEEFASEYGHKMSRDEVLVGLLQILQFGLLFSRPILSKYVQTAYGEVLLGDSTLACFPAILLFLLPSKRRPGQSLLTWPTVHDKFDFGLILLIGGAYAIADGFKQSGLNIALGSGIDDLTRNQEPLLLTFTIVLMCTICTQIFSAVGTASTLLPALNSAAQTSLKHPLSMLLPAAVACSFAFVLPTATPGNVIVLAKSQDLPRALRVRDFFFTGLPLTVITVFVGTFLIHIMEGVIFDADEPFPQWACDGVSCIWVSVPGFVGSEEVTSQACSADMEVINCTLSNGTTIDIATYMAAPGA